MGVGEDPLVLDAQPHQGMNVEEAAVVELVAGRAPEGGAKVLTAQQLVQPVGIGVDLLHHGVDGRGDVRELLAEAGQLAGEDLLVPMAAEAVLTVGRRSERKTPESVGDEGEVR